jgi:hypothetical protein
MVINFTPSNQYDPAYWLNPADFAVLAQQVPELPTQVPPQSQQDNMNKMIESFNDLNIFRSTRYIGEGSLLLLGDDDNNEEKFIPHGEQNLSNIEDGLKVLPDPQTVEELIWLYYEYVHRYTPFLRVQVVHDALRDLNHPQHLLLLNCVFFAAAPFHSDPNKSDGRVYFERAEGTHLCKKTLSPPQHIG